MKIKYILTLLISILLVLTFIGVNTIINDEQNSTCLITREIPELDKNVPDEKNTATLSVRCFFGPEAKVGVVDGVISTRVGYSQLDQKYQDTNDYTEMVQVIYDPNKITSNDLIDITEDEYKPSVFNPLARFKAANEVKQKYYLRQNKTFYNVYREIYPDTDDFINSTATARVNGYLAGHGDISSPDDLVGLGLTERGRKMLYKAWETSVAEGCIIP